MQFSNNRGMGMGTPEKNIRKRALSGVFAQDSAAQRESKDSLRRLQQDYLSVLSHDLQGFLQVIAGATLLMERAVGSGDQNVSKQLSAKILASVDAIARALGEIVEVGAMDHSVRLDLCIINVEHFVLRAFDRGVPPAERPRIKLESSPGLPAIEADEPKLQRGFLNLVRNALKFSPADTPVHVRLTARQGKVVLSVHDQGPGLSAEEMNTLFQKYRTLPQSRSRGGTGLGLYGCGLIVQAHGGRCRVESSPDFGTTFFIELPAKSVG